MAKKKKKTSKKAATKTRAPAIGPQLDVGEYTRAPVLDVPRLITLGRKMVPKVPRKPDAVARTGRAFAGAYGELSETWKALPKKARADARPADLTLDNSWAGLLERIESWTRIEHRHTATATNLIAQIFPSRLDFTKFDHATEWAESEKRLTQIAHREVERSVITLAGAEFLEAVRTAHRAYGAALGVTKEGGEDAEREVGARVNEAFVAAREALAQYTTQLAAAHNASDDKATRSALRKLLAPVDAARAAKPAAKPETKPETEPDAPVEDDTEN